MLSPYRVIDLTDTNAELGPMLLADMGADVIKVEPPGGSSSREAAPRYAGAPAGMGSLRFHALNRHKRSVTIDLGTAAGRAQFEELIAGADFLIENQPPGALAAIGLGFDDLCAVNPTLVHVAITPFGQSGPYAGHLATDLTLAAMGGMMAVTGDADRPPVRISVPQAWYHAAAESAAGAMIAHARRVATGNAQFVDVSVQASVFWTTLQAMVAAGIWGKDFERAATLLQLGTFDMPLVFPALDGEVVLVPTGATMVKAVDWLVDAGAAPEIWRTGEDWKTFDLRFLTGQPTTVSVDEVIEAIGRYTAQFNKADLLEHGLREGVTVAPCSTIPDVLEFRHLYAREYWQGYQLPGGPEVKLPGPFVRLAATPLSASRPAPGPGEHTDEVLAARRVPAALPGVTAGESALPFAGLKVADFSWIGVGPITAKYFADHGATTVRIETTNPPDRLRMAGPHTGGIAGINRSQFFGAFNTSKKGIALNLKDPAAQAVARKLLAWCDVAIESFTPGTMRDLGIGYDVAKELNPGIIMVSTCLMGQTGPAAPLAGYGYHAAAISGFYEVTGWDDRPPGGPFNAYTDVIAPHFLAATVAAALDHRRRTGEGQYIEQAQMETALHFLAPEFLDFQVNGVVPRRSGNDSPSAAPHNVYPVAGRDQWIAIAVESDGQWQALTAAMGNPEWAAEQSFDTVSGRMAARRTIDAHISAWTEPQERFGLMHRLQAAGVPAGVVQRSSDHLRDPQLAHRHFLRPMIHPEMGEVPYEGHMFRIEGSDNGPRFPAPCLGEHTYEVLTDILGLSEEEAAEALASGAVGL